MFASHLLLSAFFAVFTCLAAAASFKPMPEPLGATIPYPITIRTLTACPILNNRNLGTDGDVAVVGVKNMSTFTLTDGELRDATSRVAIVRGEQVYFEHDPPADEKLQIRAGYAYGKDVFIHLELLPANGGNPLASGWGVNVEDPWTPERVALRLYNTVEPEMMFAKEEFGFRCEHTRLEALRAGIPEEERVTMRGELIAD